MDRTTLGRTRPAMATIVAFLALFVALGSGSYAAGILTGKDVKNGSLTGKDLKDGSVSGKDVMNLTEADLTPNSLTEVAIDESSLGEVPSAYSAVTAHNVDGLKASQLLTTFGCQTGKVLGFARVKGNAGTIPNTFTTSGTYVDATYNCSGSSVVVRRVSAGHYKVKFAGNPAFLAFAQVRTDVDNTDSDVCATLRKETAAGPDQHAFDVITMTCDGASFQDADFTLLLP